jgi:NADH dehydrogenase FAD-containing subunit
MSSTRPKLVVLGGGFAGLRLLFHLHRIADITLVDPRPTSLAKPMLVEVALAGEPVEHSRFPLAPVAARHHARRGCRGGSPRGTGSPARAGRRASTRRLRSGR